MAPAASRRKGDAMWRPDTFLALPEDVIAFAWSAPMRDLAATIGISDVGLKKLFKAHGIATPPQGHWNRVHAGRPVTGPPKPPARGPGESGRVRLDPRFRGHVPEGSPLPEEGPFASRPVPEDLGELGELELKAIGKVTAPRDLSRAPAGLARLLRREDDRRAKAAATGLSYYGPRFDTPLAERQLQLLAGLLLALARRDCAGEVQEDQGALHLSLKVGDETLRLHFEAAASQRGHAAQGPLVPSMDLPAKAPLRLVLARSLRCGVTTSWTDTNGLPLEKQLAAIAADLVVAGEASFRQGLVEAREFAEQQERWREERRLERLAGLERKRMADLETSGRLLQQAEEIRALVTRVEEAMARGTAPGITGEAVARWKHWALGRADAIDPVLSGQVLSHLHVPELDG